MGQSRIDLPRIPISRIQLVSIDLLIVAGCNDEASDNAKTPVVCHSITDPQVLLVGAKYSCSLESLGQLSEQGKVEVGIREVVELSDSEVAGDQIPISLPKGRALKTAYACQLRID